jgi:2-polyprenyl-3-methyl-5-hydroxy-6-metoxy-1,4-benzoquinol methylase
MENRLTQGVTHEEACARISALFRPRWLRHYAAGKLRGDEIFRAAYELLRDSAEPILDVGCGVGLLPFYLRMRGMNQPVTGLDLDGSKIQHARSAAMKAGFSGLTFLEQDATRELPELHGNIALFDALHYLHPAAQTKLLAQLAARVAPGGMLLLRDCPRDSSARFWATYLGEIFAQTISWNVGGALHFPTRASINEAFRGEVFAREERPMFGGGPFNNWLFIFWRAEVRHPA